MKDYLNNNEIPSVFDYCTFLDALELNKKERLFQVIDHTLCHTEMVDYIMPSLEHLLRLPHTEELEDYLISYMVEIEGEHQEIGRYISKNLW